MKKDELPQDKSDLEDFTRELCYVKDNDGKYVTGLSKGWEPKKIALDVAWEEIERRMKEANEKIKAGKASPILYFMEKNIMDYSVLCGYTGFWKWQLHLHLKPWFFKRLSEKKLKNYADAFEISIDELRNYKPG